MVSPADEAATAAAMVVYCWPVVPTVSKAIVHSSLYQYATVISMPLSGDRSLIKHLEVVTTRGCCVLVAIHFPLSGGGADSRVGEAALVPEQLGRAQAPVGCNGLSEIRHPQKLHESPTEATRKL